MKKCVREKDKIQQCVCAATSEYVFRIFCLGCFQVELQTHVCVPTHYEDLGLKSTLVIVYETLTSLTQAVR